MGKRLIINADDFGKDESVNEAILDLAELGAISSTTIMANLVSENDLSRLLEMKNISTGLHFNILEGRPVSNREQIYSLLGMDGNFVGMNIFISRYMMKKIRLAHIELELQSQINHLSGMGIQLSHADSHKHIHQFPFVGKFIQDMLQRHGIKKVRNCWITDESKVKSLFYQGIWELSGLENKNLKGPETLVTSFWGCSENYEEVFIHSIDNAFEDYDCIELMTHPSTKNKKDSKLNRRGEYEFWKSMKWKDHLDEKGIDLIDYRDL
jgi:predicted glycoside hydrolase/deacetylase ChbG (UPF0249 family)